MVVRGCPEHTPEFHMWIWILRGIYRILPLAPADHAASAIIQLDHSEKQNNVVRMDTRVYRSSLTATPRVLSCARLVTKTQPKQPMLEIDGVGAEGGRLIPRVSAPSPAWPSLYVEKTHATLHDRLYNKAYLVWLPTAARICLLIPCTIEARYLR